MTGDAALGEVGAPSQRRRNRHRRRQPSVVAVYDAPRADVNTPAERVAFVGPLIDLSHCESASASARRTAPTALNVAIVEPSPDNSARVRHSDSLQSAGFRSRREAVEQPRVDR